MRGMERAPSQRSPSLFRPHARTGLASGDDQSGFGYAQRAVYFAFQNQRNQGYQSRLILQPFHSTGASR